MGPRVIAFFKMTGSGNDFVFVDARAGGGHGLDQPDRIRAVCARGTGVGADGLVLLERASDADVAIRYFNSDGSAAALCGNATLCTVRLAARLGLGHGPDGRLRIATDAGIVDARLVDGVPEFDVGPVARVVLDAPIARAPGESRIGFAAPGIPHLVVRVAATDAVDVVARGRALRMDPSAAPAGANVNFVAPHRDRPGDWMVRTYERGVEGETLACGTGAVATAIVLAAWRADAGATRDETVTPEGTGQGKGAGEGEGEGEGAGPPMRPCRLWTRSGEPVDVSVVRGVGGWRAALRGEGRLVFRGDLEEG